MTETATILFTHVEGATALRARAGDQATDQALAAHEAIVREAIERHGGRDAVSFEEGFTAAFVTPRAAVDCAAAIQRAMDAYADEGLRIRAGVHHGPVEEGPEGAVGPGVTGAAAIVAAARGRQILVSDEVRELAGTMPGLQFVDRGEFRFSADGEPTRVHEVLWSIRRERTASPIPQATTPFVGREAERDELREVLDAALAGRGSLVMISGDAGVGKSRLAEDLAEEASRRGFLALSGRCEDLEDPPAFMPLLEILRTAMSLVPQQVFRESMGAAFSGIASLLPELAEEPPSGAAPDREALLDACRDFLERTSRRRPTLLILEHLQWADAESVALIRHSADRLAQLPAVLVGLYRPGGLTERPLGAALDGLLSLPVVRSLELQRSVPGTP